LGMTGVLRLDGKEERKLDLRTGSLCLEIPLEGLQAGAHLLSATAHTPELSADTRARVFYVSRPDTELVWRKQLPAAVKAGLVVAGDLLLVARNDGVLSALDKRDGTERWTFATGGEILGTPAASDGNVVFGSGDGKVYAVSLADGKQRWALDVGLPVYGGPLLVADTAFVGDNGGRMHALQLGDGKPRWTFERADFSIESQPVLWQDLVVFGAWDGRLYAVARDDGQLRWKVYGPKSGETNGIRYFAPADCSPVIVDDALFVCDRGYWLGAYSPAGELRSKWDLKAAGIARAGTDGALCVRTTESRVCRVDLKGELVWQADIPAGRFPIPPLTVGDVVYVCGNCGRLSALRATDGQPLWSYQTTPGFYVMAAPAVDAEAANAPHPICYVAGMDGSLTAVRSQ
jgi:outer membrane protein assembly factor BamB